MRDVDRFWWAEALVSLLLAAAAVLVPVWFLSQELPLEQELGEPTTTALALGITMGVALLIAAIVMAAVAVQARYRTRRRRAALYGDPEAIPLSRIVPNPAKAPDTSAEPLVLFWQTTIQGRVFYAPAILLLALILIGELVGTPLFIIYLLFFGGGRSFTFDLPDLVAASGSMAAIAIGVALTIWMGRFIPALFGRPYGITATAEGIEERSLSGRRRQMRWEEMRLLEVATSGAGSSPLSARTYRIYDPRGRSIEWSDRPGSSGLYKPYGISPAEMTLRLNALLDLINARTGLAPRTFSKALQVPKEGSYQAAGLQAVLSLLVLATVTLGLAVATLALPLTTVSALNVTIAGSLALLALFDIATVLQGLMMRLMRSREVAPIQVPVATAPSLDTPGAAYALRYRVSLWGRLRLAAFGVVLLPNLVPLLIVWGSGSLFSFVGGGISPQVPSPLGVVLAFLLTIYGVIGLFLLALAWLWRSYIVRANVQGLSGGLGRLSTFLPWDGIERVTGRAQGGRIIAYVVMGDAGRTQIAWRAQPTWFLRIAPEPGALPITPDEMAALVVRQSGKPLQIERAR